MTLPPMKDMIEFANGWAEERFTANGGISPIWHAMDNEGQHYIIPQPHQNKDLSAEMIRMVFEEMKIVRYLFIDEAWVVRFPEHTPVEKVRESMREWGNRSLRDHPHQKEFIVFYAEDAQEGNVEAEREIIREGDAKPRLGPLRILGRAKVSEGRYVGLLPNLKGTEQ